jgi:hypothetical protein
MPGSNVTHRMLDANFFTLSYRIMGKILVPNTGVVGMMNDPTTSFMEVLDAKLARINLPAKPVSEYVMVDVVKTNVFAVCLSRREDLGPAGLARGGFQKNIEYSIRITNQVYELEGMLEWAGRFDFATIMVEGVRDFVPLYDATLTGILVPQLRVHSQAMLFNRRHVDLLGLVSEKKEG